jgi:amidase
MPVMAAGASRQSADGARHLGPHAILGSGVSTLPRLHATAMPVEVTGTGLSVGVRVAGHSLEGRTRLTFAKLVERDFGGFVLPRAFEECGFYECLMCFQRVGIKMDVGKR